MSSNLSCLLCCKELKAFDGDDLHRLRWPWAIKCGHVFHRKCLLDWIVRKQAESGNTLQTADPTFETPCPSGGCNTKFTLETAMPIYLAVLLPRPSVAQAETAIIHAEPQSSGQDQPPPTIEELKREIQQLKDENMSLGILEVHRLAEVENYRKLLEELKKDLNRITSEINQLLIGTSDSHSDFRVYGNDVTDSFTIAHAEVNPSGSHAAVPSTATNLGGRDTPSTGATVTAASASSIPTPVPVSVPPTSIHLQGEVFHDAQTLRLSASPSSSANPSFHSAASEQSTFTNRSRRSADSVPSSVRIVGGERNRSLTQSHPNLRESGSSRRKQRNGVLRMFTSFINPGRMRRQPSSDS